MVLLLVRVGLLVLVDFPQHFADERHGRLAAVALVAGVAFDQRGEGVLRLVRRREPHEPPRRARQVLVVVACAPLRGAGLAAHVDVGHTRLRRRAVIHDHLHAFTQGSVHVGAETHVAADAHVEGGDDLIIERLDLLDQRGL